MRMVCNLALLAAPMAVAFLFGCGGGGSRCGPGNDDVPPPLEVDIELPVLCEVDEECPSGEDCYAGLCLMSCGDEADCNPAERCDLDIPAFLDDCNVDADCPEVGMVCDDGTCRDPCAVAADCPHPADSCEAGVCLTSHCLLHTWVGLLAVEELEVVGAGAEHNTLVQAHFYDFTYYSVQEAEREEFVEYPACVVYTGRPVTSGDPIPLKVERVTFSGLSGGDVVLEPDEFDHLPTDLLPQRGFAGETVTVEVTSGTGLDDFPALTASSAARSPPPGPSGRTSPAGPRAATWPSPSRAAPWPSPPPTTPTWPNYRPGWTPPTWATARPASARRPRPR